METIRAVFIGLEGETIEEKILSYPPPLVIEVAFLKPISLQMAWEEGREGSPHDVVVPFYLHRGHEIHEDGVESVALYIRKAI